MNSFPLHHLQTEETYCIILYQKPKLCRIEMKMMMMLQSRPLARLSGSHQWIYMSSFNTFQTSSQKCFKIKSWNLKILQLWSANSIWVSLMTTNKYGCKIKLIRVVLRIIVEQGTLGSLFILAPRRRIISLRIHRDRKSRGEPLSMCILL